MKKNFLSDLRKEQSVVIHYNCNYRCNSLIIQYGDIYNFPEEAYEKVLEEEIEEEVNDTHLYNVVMNDMCVY